jgi:hypothetical protein
MAPADVVLHLWEAGQRSGPADRVLPLLAFALPDQGREALAGFDLALCDWHVMRARLALFGSKITGFADCPDCGERLEIEFDAAAIVADRPPPSPLYTSRDGRRFRLPTVGDLSVVRAIEDPDAAARQLFERCSLDTRPSIDAAPPNFEEVDAGLAALAAERAFHLDVTCAACGRAARHSLNPVEFLWTEIAAHAARLLDEVHELARAYGWSERDILAMSAARRAAYLRRVG